MSVLFGDVHGLFYEYKRLLQSAVKAGQTDSIILGDVGIGFPTSEELDTSDIPGDHNFIRGNHDNPDVCRVHPDYLGDYGILTGDWDGDHHYEKMFYVSGAWSIDQQWRTPGISWWEDEELSYTEMQKAINLYEQEEPDIVISHDCPHNALLEMYIPLGAQVIRTSTGVALEAMFDLHQPSLWVFAHHHRSWTQTMQGTKFICLNELETLVI